MQGDYHLLRSEKAAREWLDYLIVNHDWKRPIAVKSELNIGTRSLPQNAAMHAHFKNCSSALNEIGLDKKMVFEAMKQGVGTLWTPPSFKEDVYRPVMTKVTGKKSTTQLNKMEVSKVDEVLDQFFAERFPEFKYPLFANKEVLRNA